MLLPCHAGIPPVALHQRCFRQGRHQPGGSGDPIADEVFQDAIVALGRASELRPPHGPEPVVDRGMTFRRGTASAAYPRGTGRLAWRPARDREGKVRW